MRTQFGRYLIVGRYLKQVMSIALVMCASSTWASDYNALLKDYVKQGARDGIRAMMVDYKGWAGDARHQKAMSTYTNAWPTFASAQEKMAFWINAYNLLTIDLITREQETDSIKNLGSLFTNPWKKHQWTIGNRTVTLDEIEHKILRPMKDPRIHMAINCASLSCPDLRAEAYTADTLDQQLNEQSRLFLQNTHKGMRVDGQTLVMSKIFDWFESDFDTVGGVWAFVKHHGGKASVALPNGKPAIKYLSYNWQLNGQW